MIYVTVVMVIGLVLMQFFATPLARVFGLTEETEELCVRAMHIISAGFIAAGISIAAQGIFQALESGNSSLIVSLLRLLIIPLPLAYVFTLSDRALSLIWWAFPIGEFTAAVAAVVLLARVNKKRLPGSDHDEGLNGKK